MSRYAEGALYPWPEISAAPDHRLELDRMIEYCLDGEEWAYVAVYKRYAGPIYRLCYSLLRHREDAEEVLQDTFEYAFRRLGHYDPRKSSFKTWLYHIAVSRCRNKRRRKWLPTLPLGLFAGEDIVDERAPDPDEAAALKERQRIVWEALGQLSPKLRETAVLRYYENMTYREIGQILSIPAKTAESRMRLAHQALKKTLVDKLELNRASSPQL